MQLSKFCVTVAEARASSVQYESLEVLQKHVQCGSMWCRAYGRRGRGWGRGGGADLHGLLADGTLLICSLQLPGQHAGEVVLQVVGSAAVVSVCPASHVAAYIAIQQAKVRTQRNGKQPKQTQEFISMIMAACRLGDTYSAQYYRCMIVSWEGAARCCKLDESATVKDVMAHFPFTSSRYPRM